MLVGWALHLMTLSPMSRCNCIPSEVCILGTKWWWHLTQTIEVATAESRWCWLRSLWATYRRATGSSDRQSRHLRHQPKNNPTPGSPGMGSWKTAWQN